MLDWDEVNMDEIFKIRDNAAAYLEQTDYIPASMFAKTQRLLTDYRTRHADQANTGSDIEPIPGTVKPSAHDLEKDMGSAEKLSD
jgi:hypothetical protein